MTRRKSLHRTLQAVGHKGITETTSQSGSDVFPLTTCTSVQRVDELLRTFSDVAFSCEDEEHSWESWNFTRLSAF